MHWESFRRFVLPFIFILALGIPLLIGVNFFLLNILILMLVFIIFSSAWNLLTYSGQASLGHAAFFGIGGYVSTLLVVKMGVPIQAGIVLSGCIAAAMGLFIGITCVRLKEWFLAMVTFGFAIITETLIASPLAAFTGGWDGLGTPHLISHEIPGYIVFEYYLILAVTLATLIGIHYILKSRAGLAFAAIRENEVEARAAGVDPVKYKLLAFTISTFIAGIAGALEIHYVGYITPEIFSPQISFWPVTYSILGGLGNLWGPVIGTVVLTIFWEGLKTIGLTYERFIIIGLILILSVIFLPKGLISFPEELRKKVRKYKHKSPDTRSDV
ncbi:MAG: branched-chain amino acid ABC transporter permease [Methanomicrobiales archaeon]|nr:branched-chain amino acid ABC transporter permease [Methanomicrobiales archaeon]